MQVHLITAILVIALAAIIQIPLAHWLILLLVIAGMFSLEIMNTAIERTVDMVTREYHPLAKRAKDIAAAAVFIYCFFAVIIGSIIFVPPLIRMFS